MLNALYLSFIGWGKMAEAMIAGLLLQKLVPAGHITAAGPRRERGTELKKRFGIHTTVNNSSAAKPADIIVLAVKPQFMRQVLDELSGRIPSAALVISIAAGVTLETVQKRLNHGIVVRAMPNTPGRINKGITVWTASEGVCEEQRLQAAAILGALGVQLHVDHERYLDMATALSGTGPAYTLLFIEALVAAGVRLGMPRDIAERLTMETISGTVAYAQAAQHHPARLRDEVTSPGGTSAEALYHLERAGFRTAIADAVMAAFQRSVELGKQNG